MEEVLQETENNMNALKNSIHLGDNERDEKINACNALMKGIIDNQKELCKHSF